MNNFLSGHGTMLAGFVFPELGWLVGLGLLAVVVFGMAWWTSSPQPSAAPSKAEECPACGQAAESDWIACPLCGTDF